MTVEKDRIIEATELELYDYWLMAWSEVMTFAEYLRRMQSVGVVIKKG